MNVPRLFAGLMAGIFMSTLSVTIVAPALPRIVGELGGIELYSWILVATLVTSTIVIPIAGKLSDLYGRRRLYLGGLAVFIFGSLLCALAPSIGALIGGRLAQGVGLGLVHPLGHAIIGDVVSPRERGKYLGYIGLASGSAVILGPVLGGVLTDTLSWRWLFLLNVPAGILAGWMVGRYLRIAYPRREPRIDAVGIATFSAGLTAMVLVTALGGTRLSWDSPTIIALGVAAVTFIAIFVAVERGVPEPLIPPRLWRAPAFSWSMVAIFAIGICTYGTVFYVPAFLQGALGWDATASGVMLVPLSLALAAATLLSGRIVAASGRYRPTMLSGAVLMTVSFVLLSCLDASATASAFAIAMIVNGVGTGLVTQTFPIVVQNAVRAADLGAATATTHLSGAVGRSIGLAALGVVLTQSLGGVDVTGVLAPEKTATLSPIDVAAVRAALAGALSNVFGALAAIMVIAVLAIALTPQLSLSRAAAMEEPVVSAPAD